MWPIQAASETPSCGIAAAGRKGDPLFLLCKNDTEHYCGSNDPLRLAHALAARLAGREKCGIIEKTASGLRREILL